jgi:predicted Rossmann fold flavoprotein
VTSNYDAIVLGAGAAGLFCAARAGQAGRRVLLLEGADVPGRKILISGGGRCNFTNLDTAPERFLSANPHFAKSALSRFTPHDFLAQVEAHGIAWHEKTLGQLFCDGSARQIVAMLLEECDKGGVELRCGVTLGAVEYRDGSFHIAGASAPKLVIATGGPSIPKLGASGYARQFGLKVVQPRPALVPLTLSAGDALFRELSGVSTEVVAKCGKAAFREAALFTHRGLSGPAILQISSYWQGGSELGIDMLPHAKPDWLLEAKRTRPRATLRKLLGEALPDRLAQVLAERLSLPGDLGNLSGRALSEAETRLNDWRFRPTGSEGFAKAEVTLGGISTAELSSRTMESRRILGLYVIGEAVDVTGWLGGYNFQWAWASGAAAAESIAS